MQQNDLPFMKNEDHPDRPANSLGSELPQAIPQTPSKRHTNRPTDAQCFNVLTDDSLASAIQACQPPSDRLSASRCRIEGDPDSRVLYHFWYPLNARPSRPTSRPPVPPLVGNPSGKLTVWEDADPVLLLFNASKNVDPRADLQLPYTPMPPLPLTSPDAATG